MYMFQIEDEKRDDMRGWCKKMLHYGGMLMQELEDLDKGAEMGMREPYDDDDMMGMRDRMGMRRGRNSMGRYTRF